MKKIYLILLFFGFIGYFNIVYSAQATAEQQPEEYHMDLPIYDDMHKFSAKNELLATELTNIFLQVANKTAVKRNENTGLLKIDRYYDKKYEQVYIYFPIDAHQPTTEDAVKWSCANIDNTETSPITDWYMKMFGVIPYKGNGDSDEDYIQAGYDEDNQLKRIISYDQATMENDKTLINVPSSNTQKTKKQFFIDNFRKIASTSVGRVLLYRLLIEIRRVDKNGNGGEEFDTTQTNERKKFRALYIRTNPGEPSATILITDSLSVDRPYSGIYISEKDVYASTVATVANKLKNEETLITFTLSTLDVNIFHEFCHWFHKLRYYRKSENRKYEEWTYKIGNKDFSKNAILSDIGLFLYGHLDGDIGRAEISNTCWDSIKSNILDSKSSYATNFEEMHTILGANKASYTEYLEGDDLCENLYRANQRQPLRFGHKGKDRMGGIL